MAVNKDVLRQIIIDRIDMVKKMEIIQREYSFEKSFPYVLTGIRRSGKSYVLYQIMHNLIKEGHSWDEFLYINFEDERLMNFEINDFQALLEVHGSLTHKQPILFLDEVQNIDGWEKFARRVADEKKQVYITGSNAAVLSNDIEAILGGRYLSRLIFPFTFSEFLNASGISWDDRSLYSSAGKSLLLNSFDEYLTYGGFPEVVNIFDKRDYLSSVYQKIYLGDVIARNNINNTKALEVLVKKIAESVGQSVSFSRLSNTINSVGVKVSKTSVISYIGNLKESYLIFDVENYSSKIVDRISNPKYYFVDTGLLNLFLFDAKSKLLENLVALRLIQKYKSENVYYYEDSNCEVDFYIPEQSLAIQVSYSIYDQNTRDREINAIIKFNKFQKTSRNVILTFEEEDHISIDDLEIEVIPLYKYLLK